MQCWVTVTTARWLPVEVAAAFMGECQQVVRSTFPAVVSQSSLR
jgi:hypothetical protein